MICFSFSYIPLVRWCNVSVIYVSNQTVYVSFIYLLSDGVMILLYTF